MLRGVLQRVVERDGQDAAGGLLNVVIVYGPRLRIGVKSKGRRRAWPHVR